MTPTPTSDRLRRARRALAALAAGALLSALPACTGSAAPTTVPTAGSATSPRALAACASGSPYTLRVLASSELSDMTPILSQVARATGVTVRQTPIGSLAGAQQVIDGTADGKYDAVWFASDAYLDLWPGALARLNGTTEIMASPVVVGVRSSVARALGWDDGRVTWAQIARAAARHSFTFGMTDPADSNSGLSALVAVATAAVGKGAALETAEIPAAEPELSALFHAQVMTAPTSGPLTREFGRLLDSDSGTLPDGLIDYENELLTLQASAPENDRLTLVYPSDGVLEATYPLSILASASAAAKSAYQRLAACLTSQGIQEEIMRQTNRRPIGGSPALTEALAAEHPFVLPFPSAPSTVDDLITAYYGHLRTAGRTVYVLDTSGSMRGARLAALKQALLALCGVDTSLSSTLSTFRAGEEITFLPFSNAPLRPATFNLPPPGPPSGDQAVLATMRAYIDDLAVHGHTAIYDALVAAYRLMASQNAADPGRISSIVLLTDGENTHGRTLSQFISWYHALPPGAPPVYAIAFGQADLPELQEVASTTGGTAYDATGQPVSDLVTIFQEIRGYQ